MQEGGGGYVAPWEAIGISTEAAWVRILVVFVASAGPLVQGFRAALLGPNKITSTNYTLHLVVIPQQSRRAIGDLATRLVTYVPA